jgi:hypothetical protein
MKAQSNEVGNILKRDHNRNILEILENRDFLQNELPIKRNKGQFQAVQKSSALC